MSRLLIATVLAGLAASAQAATFGVVPQIGLAGVGATVQWGFTPYLAMTAGYTALDYSVKDVKTDTATYRGDIQLKNPQAFLNWAPFGGSFRLSAGVINQQSNFDLTADDYQDPANPQVSSVRVKGGFAESLAPAVTLGFESSLLSTGLGYHFSVGAMYAGEPDVSVDIRCNSGTSSGTCFGLEQAEERKIEDELRKYKVLPILQAGLIYRM
ncbi:MAG: hypothetical protein V4688_06515 [Pseudomonadota bacterium]